MAQRGLWAACMLSSSLKVSARRRLAFTRRLLRSAWITAIYAAVKPVCGICAGLRCTNARISTRNHSRFRGVDVGASSGNPGILTSTSRAWRMEQWFMEAMSSSVIRSFIGGIPLQKVRGRAWATVRHGLAGSRAAARVPWRS